MNTRTRPGQKRGGGFAAAHPLVRRAGYGSAPPASRLLRIADATALRAGPDPGDHCGPWGQETRAGHGLPRQARGAHASSPKRKSLRFEGIATCALRRGERLPACAEDGRRLACGEPRRGVMRVRRCPLVEDFGGEVRAIGPRDVPVSGSTRTRAKAPGRGGERRPRPSHADRTGRRHPPGRRRTSAGAGSCGCRKPMPPGDIRGGRRQRGHAAGPGNGPGR